MGKDSSIEWTKHTWNPWQGCKKVSAGCKFCYMYRDKSMYGQDPEDIHRSSDATFNKPKLWNNTDPGLVFTCSWSDFFIEEADSWRPDAWDIIRRTPNLTYQILTKRPERIMQCLPFDWGSGYDNVWLGVTVEDMKSKGRIEKLCKVPAKIHFISAEPLLEAVDLMLDRKWMIENDYGQKIVFSQPNKNPHYKMGKVDWVIVGGESGNETGKFKYRECRVEWISDIVKQCEKNDVPVFVKQLGTHLAKEFKRKGNVTPDHHGKNIKFWPNKISIRQMPACYSESIIHNIEG